MGKLKLLKQETILKKRILEHQYITHSMLMASCMNKTTISMSNNSLAIFINTVMIKQVTNTVTQNKFPIFHKFYWFMIFKPLCVRTILA